MEDSFSECRLSVSLEAVPLMQSLGERSKLIAETILRTKISLLVDDRFDIYLRSLALIQKLREKERSLRKIFTSEDFPEVNTTTCAYLYIWSNYLLCTVSGDEKT
ncbi:MAG: hypothetical protein AB1589_24015 [Cyanobacteriota bacterium]